MNQDDIELITNKLKIVDKSKDIKDGHIGIFLSSFLSLIPVAGNIIDSEINKKIGVLQNKKRDELFEAILSSKEQITIDMINNEQFILNFGRVSEVVSRLATNDKVKYFGNLIRNSYLSGQNIGNDEFEEYLYILECTSYREINYLVFLKEKEDEKKKAKKSLIWHVFLNEFSQEFGVSKKNVYNIFYRLKRTGFVDENLSVSAGSMYGNQDSGYELDSAEIDYNGFYLTNLFEDFYKKIM